METNLEECLNKTIGRKSTPTQLDNLIRGYRLYARSEGKSPKTIRIPTTAVNTLKNFLEAKGFSTDVTEIGHREIVDGVSYQLPAR
ncbi:MAG: hypothetical protein JSW24_02560 [Dehalococcoidia bacterium]|nr:MAG: hypothetical protein JSW24_02560 [Dehalococcoidia bacterium]